MFSNMQICLLIAGIMDRSIASDCQKLLQTPWQRGSPACIQRGQFWSLHSSPPPGSGFCRDHGADHQQPGRNGVVHTDRHLPPVRGHSCWRHTSHRCTCCKSLPQQRFIWNSHCETQLNKHTHTLTVSHHIHVVGVAQTIFHCVSVFVCPAVSVKILLSWNVDRKNIKL